MISAAPIVIAALAALGSAAVPLVVTTEAGRPVAGARVDFADAAGRHDVEITDAAGRASAKPGFAAVTADVSSRGSAPLHVALATIPSGRIVLAPALPVIGNVTVATGSAQSAHALPLATSTLDRTAISLSQASSSDALLRQLPGVDRDRGSSAFQNYGLSRVSFSGAGSDRGVVLVDGVPAQDGFGGQIDWQAYPTDEIVRAELLRTAGSALYGSGAVGGVLELSTFGPQTGAGTLPTGALALGAGTHDQSDDALLASTGIGPTVGVSIAGVHRELAYRDLPPAYATPIDTAAVSQSDSEHLRARYASGRTTLDGAILYGNDSQYEGRPNYDFDRYFRQENASATQRIGPLLAKAGYYVRDTTVYNLSDQFPGAPGVQRYHQHVPTDENGFYGSLTASPGTTDLVILVDQKRVQGSSQQNGPTGLLQALGTGVSLAQGVGFQATLRAKHAELLIGGRADRVRYDDLALETVSAGKPTFNDVVGHDVGAISPRAALRYDLSPRIALRVSSGGGFRAPYLNELVRGFNVGTVVMAPNPELVPERSRTDGEGLDLLLGAGRLALDFVQTRVSDAIAFETIAPTLMRRENLDRTQTNGETLELTEPVAACTRLRVSGTLQNPRVVAGPSAVVGKQLAFVPNSSATVGLDAGGPGPISYSVDGSYLGQTYYDDLNRQPLGATLLFGATVRAALPGGSTATLTAENLTHQQYLASIDRYGTPLTVALKIAVPLGPRIAARPSGCAPT